MTDRLDDIERCTKAARAKHGGNAVLADIDYLLTALRAERKRREAAEKVVRAGQRVSTALDIACQGDIPWLAGAKDHILQGDLHKALAAYREEYPDG